MHALVLRFSAIGDIILIVPALHRVIELNPTLEITVISRPFLEPLFKTIPRVKFIGIEPANYKGLVGLFQIGQKIYLETKPNLYLDLHDSLRSKFIGFFMSLRGVKVFRIDKGRSEKKELTRKNNKLLRPLKHTVSRYLEVFKNAGFQIPENSFPIGHDSGIAAAQCLPPGIKQFDSTGKINEAFRFTQIGFAPFAGMHLKELPDIKNIELLVGILNHFPRVKLILFAGKEQKSRIEALISVLLTATDLKSDQSIHIANELVAGIDAEIQLISDLDIMISMDSANLHLAALSGVPVIGIYGTTHPYLGFAPFGQESSGTYGVDGLECRPCTVYGKGICYRGDFACMNRLSITDLVIKMEQALNKKKFI